MTTQELADYIAPFLAPARRIVDTLPHKHTVTDISSPATRASIDELVKKFSKPSVRTYYLGRWGRVSQRKQLVGVIIAMVRAHNTAEAQAKFNDELLHGACYGSSLFTPTHIGAKLPERVCHRCAKTYNAAKVCYEGHAYRATLRCPYCFTEVPR